MMSHLLHIKNIYYSTEWSGWCTFIALCDNVDHGIKATTYQNPALGDIP